jgi:hypothetical protein
MVSGARPGPAGWTVLPAWAIIDRMVAQSTSARPIRGTEDEFISRRRR